MRKLFVTTSAVAALLGLAGCDSTPAQPTSQAIEQATVESTQQKLLKATPIPLLTQSLERQNLAKRAMRLNKQNGTGCVYLFASTGNLVASYPVAGKVSSLNAYLQGDTKLVRDPFFSGGGTGASWSALSIEQPDIDGTYGKNPDGIFFFTADSDAYVEWQGAYLFSDQCLNPVSAPVLTRALPASKP